MARIVNVDVQEDTGRFTFETDDGFLHNAFIQDWEKLSKGTEEQRSNWRLVGDGVHWPDLDEDLSLDCISVKENYFIRRKEHEWTVAEVIDKLKQYAPNQVIKMGADGACRNIYSIHLSSEWYAEHGKKMKPSRPDYLWIDDGH